MKKLFLIFIVCFTSIFLYAQSPNAFKYQAVVRNAQGEVMVSQTVTITISILQGDINGAEVFTEIHDSTTNEFGLVTLNIGAGNTTDFKAINWQNGPYFVKVEIEGEVMGVSQLLSVPYALHANTADTAGHFSENDPLFSASVAANIAAADISAWNNKLDIEKDSSVTNELQGLDEVLAINDSANSQIKNVFEPTAPQDAATKAYVDVLKNQVSQLQTAILNESSGWVYTSDTTGILQDIDGNEYNIVKIGTQWWMAENLRVTHYADGTEIPWVPDPGQWALLNETGEGWCYYDNNPDNKEAYGLLYSWAAAMNGATLPGVQGMCPNGWHLPSDDNWKTLEMHLGLTSAEADNTGLRGLNEGGKLKEEGTTHWEMPNTAATNSTGFTALPGGYRNESGDFSYLFVNAEFWSSSQNDTYNAWGRLLDVDTGGITRSIIDKNVGFSVRCIKN